MFQSGDLSTVTVFSTCPCDNTLNWVVSRETNARLHIPEQFIAWGSETGRPYDHRVQQRQNSTSNLDSNQNSTPDYDDMCAYRLGYI